MKIQIISDLHREFCGPEVFGPMNIVPGVETLIFAGDTHVDPSSWGEYMRTYPERLNKIAVLGNHEFYGGSPVHEKIEEYSKVARLYCKNTHLLYTSSVTVDGVRFIGTTLWTDFNKSMDIFSCEHGMNDFRKIKVLRSDGKLRNIRAVDLIGRHRSEVGFITDELLNGSIPDKTVVITHHSPSFKSIHPKFHNDPLNGGYASDLDDLILRGKPKFWIHGHLHMATRYPIGDTEIICNPQGYCTSDGYCEDTGFSKDLVIEI